MVLVVKKILGGFMKVLIATKNAGKIEGAKRALQKYFDNVDIDGISVNSDVSDQPVNEDIYIGARNRIKNLKLYAKNNNIQADLYCAIESEITNLLGEWLITSISLI